MAQINTPASEWREGASAAAEPNAGSNAGVGQYSSVGNKVKGVIPGTWEHEAKKGSPNVRPHLDKDQATVGTGNEHAAPGAGGTHTEATGHHGHHFTGQTAVAASGATGDEGMAAPGATAGHDMPPALTRKESLKDKIFKYLPGTHAFAESTGLRDEHRPPPT